MIANDGQNTARLLGYAGLIPFYAMAVAALLAGDGAAGRTVLLLQLAWAAMIASFLGAVHWGLAMASTPLSGRRVAHSVLPGLAGWGILVSYVLFPVAWPAIVLSMALFVALYVHDRNAARSGLAPDWYGVMRAPLTLLVLLALLITLIGSF